MSTHGQTHTRAAKSTDRVWRAKIGSGNTLDENKTFGIFFSEIVKQSLLNT